MISGSVGLLIARRRDLNLQQGRGKMMTKRSDKDPNQPDGRSPVDREFADRTRVDLPQQVVDSGLFDLDQDPAQLARVREIVSHLPDRTVVDVASRLRTAGHAQQTDIKAFTDRHGITPAEQRLLASLVAGLSVVDHAREQRISVNTARTHMRRLIEKTGSRGQLDLLRKFHRPG